MARRRKLSPERKEFINGLLEHYKPSDAHDVQEMLKDLLGDTLQGMLEAEMDEKLGYSRYDYKNKETDDSRNGYSHKTVTSSMGPLELDIPRDRKGEFEPQIVKKNQTDISDIEDQVLSMYAKGMTTRDISTHLRDVYGVDASAEKVKAVRLHVFNKRCDEKGRKEADRAEYRALYRDSAGANRKGRVLENNVRVALIGSRQGNCVNAVINRVKKFSVLGDREAVYQEGERHNTVGEVKHCEEGVPVSQLAQRHRCRHRTGAGHRTGQRRGCGPAGSGYRG